MLRGDDVEPDFAMQLRLDLDDADVSLVLQVFAVELDRLTAEIAAAAQAGQAGALRRAAHALFGAAGAVGAARLQGACLRAMTEADEGLPGDHAAAVAHGRDCAVAALRRVRGEMSGL